MLRTIEQSQLARQAQTLSTDYTAGPVAFDTLRAQLAREFIV